MWYKCVWRWFGVVWGVSMDPILGTALPVSNGRHGPPNMKIKFYQYFYFCASLKITLNNGKPLGCNNHNMMKDKKIQVFSFPNNNDKHLETLMDGWMDGWVDR